MKDDYQQPIAVPLFYLAMFSFLVAANVGEALAGAWPAMIWVIGGLIMIALFVRDVVKRVRASR